MDDIQRQKYQIDEDAAKAKVEADEVASAARQLLADQEVERLRQDAEDKAAQVQKDAQR